MKSFNYVHNGIKNKPPLLLCNDIKRFRFSMSGTKMKHFVLLFGMFVGDLCILDQDCNPAWEMYINLRHILEIVCANL